MNKIFMCIGASVLLSIGTIATTRKLLKKYDNTETVKEAYKVLVESLVDLIHEQDERIKQLEEKINE